MIISASRRTDIPAFYHHWFMHRVRAGFLKTRNPFNAHQVRDISLRPEDVDVIVFWTRNARPLLPDLPELDQRGLRYYFQYTITGYPATLEPHVPSLPEAIRTFRQLSKHIGAGRVIWRFDPVLISALTPLHQICTLFDGIASQLTGYTGQVIISLLDIYRKTERNLSQIAELQPINLLQDPDLQAETACRLAAIAHRHGMTISACAEPVDLSPWGILKSRCIDDVLIAREFDLQLASRKDPGQRPECGCVRSVDIGDYNTCLHGCRYCYATYNSTRVLKNRQRHHAWSPFLLDDPVPVFPDLDITDPLG